MVQGWRASTVYPWPSRDKFTPLETRGRPPQGFKHGKLSYLTKSGMDYTYFTTYTSLPTRYGHRAIEAITLEFKCVIPFFSPGAVVPVIRPIFSAFIDTHSKRHSLYYQHSARSYFCASCPRLETKHCQAQGARHDKHAVSIATRRRLPS